MLWCFIRFNSIKSVLGEHNAAKHRRVYALVYILIIIIILYNVGKARWKIHLSRRMTHRLVVVVVHTYILWASVLLLSLSIGTGTTAKTTHMKTNTKHKIHTLTPKHADTHDRAEGVYPLRHLRECVWLCVYVCVVSCFGNPVYILYVRMYIYYVHTHIYVYTCILYMYNNAFREPHNPFATAAPSPQTLWFIVWSARSK